MTIRSDWNSHPWLMSFRKEEAIVNQIFPNPIEGVHSSNCLNFFPASSQGHDRASFPGSHKATSSSRKLLSLKKSGVDLVQKQSFQRSVFSWRHQTMKLACCCCLVAQLQPRGLQPARLLCPWPGSSVHGIFQAEYWSGLPFLLRGLFLTQGLNLHLLRWQADSLPLCHKGSL